MIGEIVNLIYDNSDATVRSLDIKFPRAPYVAGSAVGASSSSEPVVVTFTTLDQIGKGSFGTVYRATGAPYYDTIALKIARGKSQRLRQEIDVMTRCCKGHLLIARMDFAALNAKEDLVAIGMEMCVPLTLHDFLSTFPLTSESDMLALSYQVVQAVAAVHAEDCIHRDIKLQNFVFDLDSNLKLIDFGLAATTHTPRAGDIVGGTIAFMAPEMASNALSDVGRVRVGVAADVWSVGIVLFSIVTQRNPYPTVSSSSSSNPPPEEDPAEQEETTPLSQQSAGKKEPLRFKSLLDRVAQGQWVWPVGLTVSPELRQLISSLLTKDPARRPSLREVLQNKIWNNRTRAPLRSLRTFLGVEKIEPLLAPSPEQKQYLLRNVERKSAMVTGSRSHSLAATSSLPEVGTAPHATAAELSEAGMTSFMNLSAGPEQPLSKAFEKEAARAKRRSRSMVHAEDETTKPKIEVVDAVVAVERETVSPLLVSDDFLLVGGGGGADGAVPTHAAPNKRSGSRSRAQSSGSMIPSKIGLQRSTSRSRAGSEQSVTAEGDPNSSAPVHATTFGSQVASKSKRTARTVVIETPGRRGDAPTTPKRTRSPEIVEDSTTLSATTEAVRLRMTPVKLKHGEEVKSGDRSAAQPPARSATPLAFGGRINASSTTAVAVPRSAVSLSPYGSTSEVSTHERKLRTAVGRLLLLQHDAYLAHLRLLIEQDQGWYNITWFHEVQVPNVDHPHRFRHLMVGTGASETGFYCDYCCNEHVPDKKTRTLEHYHCTCGVDYCPACYKTFTLRNTCKTCKKELNNGAALRSHACAAKDSSKPQSPPPPSAAVAKKAPTKKRGRSPSPPPPALRGKAATATAKKRTKVVETDDDDEELDVPPPLPKGKGRATTASAATAALRAVPPPAPPAAAAVKPFTTIAAPPPIDAPWKPNFIPKRAVQLPSQQPTPDERALLLGNDWLRHFYFFPPQGEPFPPSAKHLVAENGCVAFAYNIQPGRTGAMFLSAQAAMHSGILSTNERSMLAIREIDGTAAAQDNLVVVGLPQAKAKFAAEYDIMQAIAARDSNLLKQRRAAGTTSVYQCPSSEVKVQRDSFVYIRWFRFSSDMRIAAFLLSTGGVQVFVGSDYELRWREDHRKFLVRSNGVCELINEETFVLMPTINKLMHDESLDE